MTSLFNRIQRNKRKFIIIGGVLTTAYAAYKLSKYIRADNTSNRNCNEVNFKIMQAQYFQSMLLNCKSITEKILEELEMEIDSSIDSEMVAKRLGIHLGDSPFEGSLSKEQYTGLSAKTKLELWQKLKVLSFTKLTLLLYCWSYLTVTIHIQMAILAGHLFTKENRPKSFDIISSVKRILFSPKLDRNLDEKFQTDFIHLTLKQLKQELPNWIDLVHGASLKVVGKTSLKRIMAPDDIVMTIEEIRNIVRVDVFALCNKGLQLHNYNEQLEGPMYVTLMDVFQDAGMVHIDQLVEMFLVGFCDSLKVKIGLIVGESEDGETYKMALAQFIPHIWSFSALGSGDSGILGCVREFCSKAPFRMMVFRTYEGCVVV